MSAYKHSPLSALAGFTVSRCIGTCLRTYPPVGGLPPARAKYTEHKRSLCNGYISLSNAEGLLLFHTIRLLLGLTLRFMGVSALFICPYPGCFNTWITPSIMQSNLYPIPALSIIYRGVPRSCSYHQERITSENSPALLTCPDILFLPVSFLPLWEQFYILNINLSLPMHPAWLLILA